jgi:hypothetical protein
MALHGRCPPSGDSPSAPEDPTPSVPARAAVHPTPGGPGTRVALTPLPQPTSAARNTPGGSAIFGFQGEVAGEASGFDGGSWWWGHGPGRRIRRLLRRVWWSDTAGSSAHVADPPGGRGRHISPRCAYLG